MKTKTQRVPDPDVRVSPPGPRESRKRSEKPAYDHPETDYKPDNEISHNDNEATNEYRRSVTNTDEQNKVTNTEDGSTPLDEKETEGV